MLAASACVTSVDSPIVLPSDLAGSDGASAVVAAAAVAAVVGAVLAGRPRRDCPSWRVAVKTCSLWICGVLMVSSFLLAV